MTVASNVQSVQVYAGREVANLHIFALAFVAFQGHIRQTADRIGEIRILQTRDYIRRQHIDTFGGGLRWSPRHEN